MVCLKPVYAVDTPVAELRTAELLLVTTLRLFAVPWRDPEASLPDWRGGFSAAGIEAGASLAFAALFGIVAAAPRRPLDVRLPCCAGLGMDEGWLLQMVSLLQRGRTREAEAVLAEWLPAAGARMALLPAQGVAEAMAGAGLVVPLRHPEAARQHGMRIYADRGLALVQ